MISKKLKDKCDIGFCGLGKQSQKLMKILKKNKFNVVAGLNNYSKKNKKIIKKIYPKIVFHNSIEEIIKSNINILVVATNHENNYKFTYLAIQNEINVFVEKPVFKNRNQIDKLYKLAKKKNVFFQINYKYIYSKLFNNFLNLKNKKINFIFFDWKKFGSFDNDILFNLAIHDFALIFKHFIKVNYKINYINKIINNDFLLIHLILNDINIVIRIDRLSKNYTKKISIYMNNGNIYEYDFLNNCIENKSLFMKNKLYKYNKIDENELSLKYFLNNVFKNKKLLNFYNLDIKIFYLMKKLIT